MPLTQIQSWTCLRCEETFKAPKWTCEDGQKHTVTAKTYYVPIKNLRVYVTEERVFNLGDGRNRVEPARAVDFTQGQYSTRDPQEQAALDIEPSLCSLETWRSIHLDDETKAAMQRNDIKQAQQAVDREKHSLLEQQKAMREQQADLDRQRAELEREKAEKEAGGAPEHAGAGAGKRKAS